MPKIKVYPTHENAFTLVHPTDGPISHDGSLWEQDGFTGRMLDDGAVTTDTARAHKFSRPQPDHSKPPAHATGVPEADETADSADLD